MTGAILAMLQRRGLVRETRDLCEAQNQVNRLHYRFGRIGRILDVWYRVGKYDGEAMTEASLDLLFDAYGLAANIVGPERLEQAMAARIAAWNLHPGRNLR